MRNFNSTIQIKLKPCNVCGKPSKIFSKGRCTQCAVIADTLARDNEEIEQSESLSILIADLDLLFSRFIRQKARNERNEVICFICDKVISYSESQCMHYIPRGNLFLRWDERNCTAGCKTCNEYKGGNLIKYAAKLEQRSPGITEILYIESKIPYKPTRNELKELISHISKQLT